LKKPTIKEMLSQTITFAQSNGTLCALIVLCVIASLSFPAFFTSLNLSNIVKQQSMIGLVAIGMTFVILSGGIDLSVGSIVAVSAVVAAMLSGQFILFPVVVPILVGLCIGIANGLLITKLRISPFIATLAMMLGARGLAFIITGGETVRSPAVTEVFIQISRGYVWIFPYFGIIFFLFIVAASIVLNRTSFGRRIYAVGGNEEAARMMGLDVDKEKIIVYAISGGLSGAAGVLLTSRLGSGQPYVAGGWELSAIAAVVIGGTLLTGGVGKMSGTLWGVLILGVISNMINMLGTLEYWYANFATGILLLTVILLQSHVSKQQQVA
jgi:ribose/xylose/arabinose/galactoside ABC-type transport system permease subunit